MSSTIARDDAWTERRESWNPREDDPRTPFEVDYSRIIHSASFRRLQGKTQILDLGDGDFHRTRLTHSLEVSQIAQGMIQRLRARHVDDEISTLISDPALMQTISLVHDLGHPPYGHGGEEALNYMMRDHGGFEGNGQTLRILARLENFSDEAGANLTRRTLLGTLKYPVSYSQAMGDRAIPEARRSETGIVMLDGRLHGPPKCYLDCEEDVVTWLLAPLGRDQARQVREGMHKSFDASMMDIADDQAYSIGDLEDSLALRLVDREQLLNDVPASLWDDFLDHAARRYDDHLFGSGTGLDCFMDDLFRSGRRRKSQIGKLTNYALSRVRVVERKQFSDPVFRYAVELEPHAMKLVNALKKFILHRVINSAEVQHGRYRGQLMLMRVFEILAHDPQRHLSAARYEEYLNGGRELRAIADYVSGMTDQFLGRTYDRFFTPRAGSVFDKL